MRLEIEAGQRQKLRALLAAILRDNPFYAAKLRGASIDSDLASLPFTLKQELVEDQAAHPPYGSNLTYPLDRYTHFWQTSATSCTPLRWLDTAESWDWTVDNWTQVWQHAGLTASDTVFFAFSFGPFLGFWAGFEAASRMGCLVIPGGGMRTAARLRTIVDASATVLCCTPTYALRLAEAAAQEGIDLAASKIRTLVVAGEPGASVPGTRSHIVQLWHGANLVDHHGMSEIGPVSYGCPALPGVLHVIESSFIAEVIEGELVLTNLGRLGSPILRYRTGDVVDAAPPGRCACGTYELALRGGILRRTDEMLVVRGVNLYPSAVEDILFGCGVAEYRVQVHKGGSLPEVTIEVEPPPQAPHAKLAARLETEFANAFALRIPVSLVPYGSLEDE
jgi:phenylacetate-CoA ligase